MERLKLIESMAFFTAATGEDIKEELTNELFPNSSKQVRAKQFKDFATSKETQKFIKRARIICDKCNVDGKFLLGF